MTNELTAFGSGTNTDYRPQDTKKTGRIIWFTGLSGSGKSTLSSLLEKRLKESGFNTFPLDGDDLRSGLNSDLGFSAADRTENLRRAAHIARLALNSGMVVPSSFISPLAAQRALIRQICGPDHFLEVYVKCSPEECERRDTKGLYRKARSGEIHEFTGISSAYEIPNNPDLIIDTELLSKEEAIDIIWHSVAKQLESAAVKRP